MSTAHTPGPWAAFTDGSGTKPHTNIVAYVPRTTVVFSLPGHEKTEADVRLIAAAPDLLEALISLCRRARAELADPEDAGELESARHAIAKAIGSAS